MAALATYSTGTATVADGGTTVTGISTIWSGVNARPGDVFQIGEFQTIISDVVDVDELTIPPWGGGAQTGVAYVIHQVSPQRFAGAQAMADVAILVGALNTSGFFFFVDTDETEPDPSLGEDGQYAMQPATGKVWLKDSGTWNFIGYYKPFGVPAPWDSGTAYELNDVATLDGSSYVCIEAHTNHTPPNLTYWAVLASKGDTGAAGSAQGIRQAYSTTTADADPGNGVFRLNHATPASATAAYLDNLDAGGATVSGIFDLFDDSTATTKGVIRFQKTTDPAVWAQFAVTGSVVDGTGYRKLTLSGGAGSGAFTNSDSFSITFFRSGDNGANGTNGAGYGGTSTTSLAIGTGTKVFTTQAGLAYTDGARVRASSDADTSDWMEGLVTYSGTTLTMTSDKTSGSGTLADWNLNVVGEPGAGDLSSANNLSELSSTAVTAKANIAIPAAAQCVLSKVSTNLVLSPKNGNLLTINGAQCTVPDAGVSLAATGLTPGTLYYIYATQSAGVVNALEASTTAYAVSTAAGNKGVVTKSGDDTRTLVGMARPITGPAWADTATQRFVRSWFNDPGIVGKSGSVTQGSLTTASNTEISTSLRAEFLSWSGEMVQASIIGSAFCNTAGISMVLLSGLDATAEAVGSTRFDTFTASINASVPFHAATNKNDLSEGYHFATGFYSTSGGTSTYTVATQLVTNR